MKNTKKLIRIFTFISLMIFAGCDAVTTDSTKNYKLPEGLADCKIYTMEGSEQHPILNVVRCPLSEIFSLFLIKICTNS